MTLMNLNKNTLFDCNQVIFLFLPGSMTVGTWLLMTPKVNSSLAGGPLGANSGPCVTFLVAVTTSFHGSYNLQCLTFEFILTSMQAATMDVSN